MSSQALSLSPFGAAAGVVGGVGSKLLSGYLSPQYGRDKRFTANAAPLFCSCNARAARLFPQAFSRRYCHPRTVRGAPPPNRALTCQGGVRDTAGVLPKPKETRVLAGGDLRCLTYPARSLTDLGLAWASRSTSGRRNASGVRRPLGYRISNSNTPGTSHLTGDKGRVPESF